MTSPTLTRTRFGDDPKTVTLRTEGDQVRIDFNYDPRAVDAVRELKGRKYDPETKTWTIPTPATTDRFQDVEAAFVLAGFRVEIDGEQVEESAQTEPFPGTATCALCGASEVPRHGKNWWETNQHRAGEVYDRKRAYSSSIKDRCKGEDMFLRELRNAKLAISGAGLRLETDAEHKARLKGAK